MAITPNPAFDVNFTQNGDETRQAISKYISSKAEIYTHLNDLQSGVNDLQSGEWSFKVNGEDI